MPFTACICVDLDGILPYSLAVSSVEHLEKAILKLERREQEALREWLENLLEDGLEITDAFRQEIEAGKADIKEGRVRVRQP
jgi:hypothetical protein